MKNSILTFIAQNGIKISKKYILSALLMFIFTICTYAQNANHVYVNGYTKSNGTYVQGYYRTAPNSTINDNFSTAPNVNPYTGKQGSITPSYYDSYNNSNSYKSYTPSYTYTTPSYNYSSSSYNAIFK